MKIDKTKLKTGIWYEDENGNRMSMTENELRINGKSFDETISQLEEFMESDDVHGELFTVLRSARDFMENLNEEIQQYRAIGTVEELKDLKEKSTPKKGIPYTSSNNHKFVECPSCHKDMDLYYDFCQYCGQSVDWGKPKT